MATVVPTPDLAARTLQLVDVLSESRREGAVVELVRGLLPGEPLYDDGEVLLAGDSGAPILLAGHLDTVPAQDNVPGRIEDGAVHGLGASDMKGGVAVMLELARAGVPGRYLFFTREELPVAVSPLPTLFATGLLAGATSRWFDDCILHGVNVEAQMSSTKNSRGMDNRTRPALVRGLETLVDLEPLDVELDGLVYREVVSAVRVAGGIASNVIPPEASVELNFRYAPGRTRADAEARLRELAPDGELRVLSNSAAAMPSLTNALVRKLRELVPDVAPKQAWTPVAQFAEQGIDAINYGPGATAYAHKRDEQVPIENLERCYDTLLRFLLDTV
jgi:succinyl-diaminopimelate desuccinylase